MAASTGLALVRERQSIPSISRRRRRAVGSRQAQRIGAAKSKSWWPNYLGVKVIRHRQRAPLVGFQGNLLRQHDVARDEIILRYEAPANPRSASGV